jgi:CBS domain-containing protein
MESRPHAGSLNDETWRQFLSGITAKDLLQEENFKLIAVNQDSSLAHVLEVFEVHKISAAPVINKTTNSIVGMIDMVIYLMFFNSFVTQLDLVTYCTAIFSPTFLTKSIAHQQTKEFLNKEVGSLVELSSRNWWNEVPSNTSLLEIVGILSHPDVHRVAILKGEKTGGEILGLLTQSSVARFLFKNRDKLGAAKLQTPILRLRTCEQVESLTLNSTLLEALRVIWGREVSGVAVVDEEGVLVGTVSSGDLKVRKVHV